MKPTIEYPLGVCIHRKLNHLPHPQPSDIRLIDATVYLHLSMTIRDFEQCILRFKADRTVWPGFTSRLMNNALDWSKYFGPL